VTALPLHLRVRVVPALHTNVPIDRLLVGLDFRYRGRTYYSTLLGLTNSAGEVKVDGQQLARDFHAAQHQFPMDYRLSLEECDDTAIVGVGGGLGFEKSRATALSSALVREPYRTWWQEAQDQTIAENRAAITLDGSPVEVTLKARKIGLP